MKFTPTSVAHVIQHSRHAFTEATLLLVVESVSLLLNHPPSLQALQTGVGGYRVEEECQAGKTLNAALQTGPVFAAADSRSAVASVA